MNVKRGLQGVMQKTREHYWLFLLLLLVQAAFFIAAYFLLSYYQTQLTQAMSLITQSDQSAMVASFRGFIDTINTLLVNFFILFGLFHAALWTGMFMVLRTFSWRDAGKAFVIYIILFVVFLGPVLYWARVILGSIITLSAEENLIRTGYALLAAGTVGYLLLLLVVGIIESDSPRTAGRRLRHLLRKVHQLIPPLLMILAVIAGSILLLYFALLTERLLLFIPAALLVVVILVVARLSYLVMLHTTETSP